MPQVEGNQRQDTLCIVNQCCPEIHNSDVTRVVEQQYLSVEPRSIYYSVQLDQEDVEQTGHTELNYSGGHHQQICVIQLKNSQEPVRQTEDPGKQWASNGVVHNPFPCEIAIS